VLKSSVAYPNYGTQRLKPILHEPPLARLSRAVSNAL
jgi:hypothetical protein